MPEPKPSTMYADLIAAQKAFPSIRKDNTADTGKFKYKYADLGDILDRVKPVLHANNFALVQATDVAQTGDMTVETRLYHVSGEHISSSYPVRCIDANDPQKVGGALTYARRYALMAMLGLAAEDDDAQASSRATTSNTQTRQHEANPLEPMTHEAFGDAVRKAIADKDGAGFAKLADHAGELVGRWMVLVKATESGEALEWVEKQIGRRGIADPILLEEIRRQQNKLGVAPSTVVRQARRENVLPGELFSADEIEAGREAADRLTR